MVTIRKKLHEELTRRFLPALRARGFVGPDRINGNALIHEFRRSASSGFHILSIQLDKWQRPRFVLNLHVEPPEGLEAVIARGGTIVQARAKPRSGGFTRNWFCADRPWWQRLFGITSSREHEAVSEALAMLDELEAWWQTQAFSKNVSNLSVTFRAPHEIKNA